MVEHATENRGVPSSILGLGTLGQKQGPDCGRSTVVVRLLAKEKVVGSNPIARSAPLRMASWPSGKARVCKTLIQGFESPRRLSLIDGVRPTTDASGRLFILNSFIISLSSTEYPFVL